MIHKFINFIKTLFTKLNNSQINEIESFISLEQKAPSNLEERVEMENLFRNR